MLAIQIGCGDVVSEELFFPLDSHGCDVLFSITEKAKRENRSLTIHASKSSVPKLPSCLNGTEVNDQTQLELEFLGTRLGYLTVAEQDILSAALEIEKPETLKEIINLSYNLGNYELLRDISDSGRIAAELLSRGKKITAPEAVWPLLDFEQIRDSYFDTHQGAYCPSGLV